MRSVHDVRPTGSAILTVASGDEAIGALTQFAHERAIGAAAFTGIGVFSGAVIGYFNPRSNAYDEFVIDEACEVLAFSGTVTTAGEGQPVVHAHVALGMADSSVRGGHLLSARVHPTLEITVNTYDPPVGRELDDATGHELICASPEQSETV